MEWIQKLVLQGRAKFFTHNIVATSLADLPPPGDTFSMGIITAIHYQGFSDSGNGIEINQVWQRAVHQVTIMARKHRQRSAGFWPFIFRSEILSMGSVSQKPNVGGDKYLRDLMLISPSDGFRIRIQTMPSVASWNIATASASGFNEQGAPNEINNAQNVISRISGVQAISMQYNPSEDTAPTLNFAANRQFIIQQSAAADQTALTTPDTATDQGQQTYPIIHLQGYWISETEINIR